MKKENGKMKWLLCGIGVILAAAGIFTAVKLRNHPRDTDSIDGGVVHHSSGDDAPKVIESTEITEFRCEFSLLTFTDPGVLKNAVYTLEATRTSDGIKGRIEINNRAGDSSDSSFIAEDSFMEALASLVSEHNLASHNGYVHTVSGLPDMYGALLDVKYASGESIYTRNNQDCFLSLDAMTALTALFEEQNSAAADE